MDVAVDCVVFGADDRGLKVLLVQSAGAWALPGGPVLPGETLDAAARRELERATSAASAYLEQLYTFDDPRRQLVTVAWYALAKPTESDTWVPVDELPALAEGHLRIFETALARLRAKVRYQPIGFELLPAEFTLSRLQRLYEAVLARPLDKRNFRKKILAMGLLVETGMARGPHRSARLYRFDRRKYKALEQQGFNFEI